MNRAWLWGYCVLAPILYAWIAFLCHGMMFNRMIMGWHETMLLYTFLLFVIAGGAIVIGFLINAILKAEGGRK
jgi:hypothetical protein